MYSYNFDYYLLSNDYKQNNATSPWIWRSRCIALFIVNVIIAIYLITQSQNHFPPLDQFQPLNNLSAVGPTGLSSSSQTTTILNPNEHAVVSAIYSESYIMEITTLGYSLKAANVSARMILIYVPDRMSSRTLCLATAAGWTLHPVSLVPPPHGGKGVNPQYTDNFTKLRLWTLDSIGIKSLVYLDADTLVRRNFDELFLLPFNFAAVPDMYRGRGFTMSFNAGVLFLRPSTAVFKDMLDKLETTVYAPHKAEHGFLNVYFGSQVTRLPFAYNANLAIKPHSPKLWETMAPDMRIVHYASEKPFPRYRLGSGETLRRFFEGRLSMKNGLWAEEMGWWQESWQEMAIEMQTHSKCSSSE